MTAPFGDRFRTVCRYTMAAVTPTTAQLRIDYAMTYAKPIPGWGRAMLEPAAESGLAKNFAQFIAVLSDFIALSDASVPVSPIHPPTTTSPPAPPPAPSTAGPPLPAADAVPRVSHVTAILTAAGSQRRIRTVRTMFVDDHVVDLFLPVAEVLLMSAGLSNSGDVAVRGAAALLSTASVLLLLQMLLNLWHRIGEACERSRSMSSVLCAQAHRAVDLPQSVAGVFVATVVIMSLRSLMGAAAAQVGRCTCRCVYCYSIHLDLMYALVWWSVSAAWHRHACHCFAWPTLASLRGALARVLHTLGLCQVLAGDGAVDASMAATSTCLWCRYSHQAAPADVPSH